MKRFTPWLLLGLCIGGLLLYRLNREDILFPNAETDLLVNGETPSASVVADQPLSECLLTPNRLRHRVLVVGKDAVLRPDADIHSVVGEALQPLSVLYVFAQNSSTERAQLYQVGATPYRDSIIGWAAAADVVP